VAKAQDFDANACHAAIGDGPIFINGGGNFGDLWPTHQVFLRELLVTFPDRPVIQLPQSIHFRDPANLAATARAIAGHDRFHLLVRDRASLALARRFDCATRLCCDLAVWLGPQVRPRPPAVDVLCLLREDRERAFAAAVTPVSGRREVTDWVEESVPAVRSRRLLAIAGAAVRGRLDRNELRRVSFEAAAQARVQRGLRLLARGRTLVTDRLHGHLLAVLLGLPHAVLDNSYGKVGAFIDCWTRNCPQFAAHTEPEQAVQWAEEAAAASGHEATG
jgi:pyruvyl transferase EpsO